MRFDPTKFHFVEPSGSSATGPSYRRARAASIHHVDPVAESLKRQTASLRLRMGLLVGCTLSVALAGVVGHPAPFIAADPELARMLRGMAVLKALMVACGVGAIGWRMGHPITLRTAALYGVGASAVAGATALIWQLTWLGPAALVFHLGAFLLLLVAFVDARGGRAAISTTEVTDVPGSAGP